MFLEMTIRNVCGQNWQEKQKCKKGCKSLSIFEHIADETKAANLKLIS